MAGGESYTVLESVSFISGWGDSRKRTVLESVSSFVGKGILYHTASDGIYLVLGRWGVSLTRPVLKSAWLYVGCEVYFIHPTLASVWFSVCQSFCYTSRHGICLVVRRVGSFSYESRGGNCLVVRRGERVGAGGQGKAGSLPYTPRARFSQAFRRVGETLFQGLHWNLSHRAVGE